MEIRPFSTQNFEQKLANFQFFISDITFRETELSCDERRTKILGNYLGLRENMRHQVDYF